jgi:hypothetical protein
LFYYGAFSKLEELSIFAQCSPKVSADGAIFCSVLAANIDYCEVYAYLYTAKNFEPDTA